MAKVALLIGVGEYGSGLAPLLGATKDIELMEQVLKEPNIGGFDNVVLLANAEPLAMQEAIETLFTNRQKDDLVLLYFSGHGIRDDKGRLYFATRITCKDSQGKLVKAKAVPASFVHDIMSNSKSKHQVVILDCCFSGAFAEGLLAKADGFVDLKHALGGEGRAILTSSSSIDYSFEDQGGDISIYTRYIVEGIKTGVADRDGDGWVSVDELHDYAKEKVQEAAPAMKPEIYAIREGYKIKLAQAPIGDPKLIYRQEVEYWVKAGNGEISDIGRITLDEKKESLGITSEEARVIEVEVLEPIKEYDKKSNKYKDVFLKKIQGEYPIGEKTREQLKRLQKALRLSDEDIAKIENILIEERQRKLLKYEEDFFNAIKDKYPVSDRVGTELKNLQQNLQLTDNDIAPIEAKIIAGMQIKISDANGNVSQIKNRNYQLLIGLLFGVIVGGTVVGIVEYFIPPNQAQIASCIKEQEMFDNKISLGRKILIKQDTSRNKEEAVNALSRGDCTTAIDKLNAYRKEKSSDPEALIYLNNAKAFQQAERLKIAVSVPIGSNPNVAKEILRGVAQAQNEVNTNCGMNGKCLVVVIANDDNNGDIAKEIAFQFIKDTSILAVVGHNSANATLPAALEYQAGELVMISPTTLADALRNSGDYIFRTVPTTSLSAEILAHQIVQKARKINVVLCFDNKATDTYSFQNTLQTTVRNAGGTINPTRCELSDDALKPDKIITEAINSGADALLLNPYVDKISQAIKIAQANKKQPRPLPLFSQSTMHTYETLKSGQVVDGMTMTTPWHPQLPQSHAFVENAQKLWGGNVSWRTATAYDAARAIITGLKQNTTRSGLQQVLRKPEFSSDGAMGKIQFDPSGDRKRNFVLIQVQKSAQKPTGYDFVLLP